MKYAVLIGNVFFESQARILRGIRQAAQEENSDVYVFTGGTNRFAGHTLHEKGENDIYSLPRLSSFDAVIFHPDTIFDDLTVRKLTADLIAAGVPCVTINNRSTLYPGVVMDNRSGFKELLEHLYSEHGLHSLYYISGPDGSVAAEERLLELKSFAAQKKIAFTENDYAKGDYSFAAGREIMERYFASGRKLPQVIIAANDNMAVGAAEVIEKHGLKIPQDVLLTGYDDTAFSAANVPALTTVSRGEYECGAAALRMASSWVKTGIRPAGQTVYSHIRVRCSCGCNGNENDNNAVIRENYITDMLKWDRSVTLLKGITVNIASIRYTQDLLDICSVYLPLSGIRNACICLCAHEEGEDEEEEQRVRSRFRRKSTRYPEKMTAEVIYRDGRFLGSAEYDTDHLLPENARLPEGGNYYCFMPLHHRDKRLGYIVFTNQYDLCENSVISLVSFHISEALVRIRQTEITDRMMMRLDRLRTRDELTGTLNRSGMNEYWPALLKKAVEKGMKVFAMFADIDLLKTANDRFGHVEGDRYIKVIAEVLSSCLRKDELLVRYGGDEYIILGLCEENAEDRVQEVTRAMDEYNKEHPCPYERGISVGAAASEVSRDLSLDSVITAADMVMYKEKEKKKLRR